MALAIIIEERNRNKIARHHQRGISVSMALSAFSGGLTKRIKHRKHRAYQRKQRACSDDARARSKRCYNSRVNMASYRRAALSNRGVASTASTTRSACCCYDDMLFNTLIIWHGMLYRYRVIYGDKRYIKQYKATTQVA